ncbi:CRISPR-associated endoribonuclease Cas6 [Alkaliphilus metalliredigens]|uniref:CRISPR-associated endoribonuclease Cas6 n=1 Tax=Alkaliphilus metalliredigens TaxID=208226 RepID=UPI0002EC0D1F|nr:CRISPR-associated endoribonuclease Cas6 [Alkaliphilus metalliredigens]
MRFGVEIFLEKEMLPKDKNRIILSIIKNCFSSCNKEYYKALYKDTPNQTKDFTFSLYLGDCKFLREEILVPSKKIYLNFSTYHNEDGIMFFNSMLMNKGKAFSIRDNTYTIGKINLKREKLITEHQVIFKTMSPIVAREHQGDNKKTWYHSLNTEEGQAVFLENLQYQLKDAFGEGILMDSRKLSIEVSQDNKEVKVKNYGIEILSNLAKIRIQGAPYILDYLYKAGIGSKRGSGFGMVDIV